MPDTITLTLSQEAVKLLVRMWGISLAALHRNAKVVAAATLELAVFCSEQDKIAKAIGNVSPFVEVGETLHPFLTDMIAETKSDLIAQGKDPDEILRKGREKLGVENLPPFEEDGEPDFS